MDDVPTSAAALRALQTLTPELEACTDEDFLSELAGNLRKRSNILKRDREKAERLAKEAPWLDEAMRWEAGQTVYIGRAIDSGQMYLTDSGMKIVKNLVCPAGQKATVSYVQTRAKRVWLKFPKSVTTERKDKLHCFYPGSIWRDAVSRVPLKERPEGWRKP